MRKKLFRAFCAASLLAAPLIAACGGETGVDQQNLAAASNGGAGGNGNTGGNGVGKTTICHIPPGNPANAHTITVGNPAVPAHLAHGDFIGGCGGNPPPPPPSSNSSDGGPVPPPSSSSPDANVPIPPIY